MDLIVSQEEFNSIKNIEKGPINSMREAMHSDIDLRDSPFPTYTVSQEVQDVNQKSLKKGAKASLKRQMEEAEDMVREKLFRSERKPRNDDLSL